MAVLFVQRERPSYSAVGGVSRLQENRVDNSVGLQTLPTANKTAPVANVKPVGVSGTIRGIVYSRTGDIAREAHVEAIHVGHKGHVHARRATFSGTTDDHGRFTVSELPLGLFLILATRDGEAARGRCLLEAAAPQGEVVLVLEAAGTIQGVVVDAHGNPVPHATVYPLLLDERKPPFHIWFGQGAESDELGRFSLSTLEPGVWRIHAAEAGHGSALSGPIPTGTLDAVITLDGGTILSGRVVYSDNGQPAEGASISLSDEDANYPPVSAATDADGQFTFAAVARGNYVIEARGKPGFATEEAFYPVAVGAEAVDDVEIRLVRGGVLRGRVYAAESGQGIDGAVVTARPSGGPRRVYTSAASDIQGNYEIIELPGGSYTVQSPEPEGFLQGFDTKGALLEVELSAGNVVDHLDFALNHSRAISGRVLDVEGNSVAGAEVRAREGGIDCFIRSASDGSYSIPNPPRGDAVTLMAATISAESEIMGPLSVPESGLAGVDLILTRTHDGTLGGVVVDTRNRPLRARVIARPLSGSITGLPPMDTSDLEGRFLIVNIAPDSYALQVQSGAGGSRELLQVVMKPGRHVRDLRLVYDTGDDLAIAGRVSTRDEVPLSADLRLSRAETDGSMELDKTESGTDGLFRFEHVPQGTYRIGAFKSGFVSTETQLVEAGTEDLVIYLDASVETTVQVVDTENRPIPQFEIALVGPGGEPGPDLGPDIYARSFFIPVTHPNGVYTTERANVVQVLVRAQGYAQARKYIEPDPDTVTVVVLQRADAIRGRVITGDGAPVAGASVAYGALPFPTSRLADAAISITDVNGAFSVSPSEPGKDSLLSAFHPELGAGEGVFAGSERLEIVLAPGGRVVGTVLRQGRLVSGANVRISNGSGLDGAVSDASGRFQIQNVPAGEYTIFVRDSETGESRGEQRIDVGMGMETDVELPYE